MAAGETARWVGCRDTCGRRSPGCCRSWKRATRAVAGSRGGSGSGPFLAVAELLAGAAQESGLVMVVEDVHWADSATLDCLTYLAHAAGADAVTLVVTCRGGRGAGGCPVGRVAGARPERRGAGDPAGTAVAGRGGAADRRAGGRGTRRAGLLMTYLRALRVTRFSLSSWWPRRWPVRCGMCCARRTCCRQNG